MISLKQQLSRKGTIMKKTIILFLALFAVSAMAVSSAEAIAHIGDDGRSLVPGSPAESAKWLMHMRNHLGTIQKVVAALALDDFSEASRITKKGFGHGHGIGIKADSEAFSEMEHVFEESADKLAKTFKTKDMKKSLAALEDTLQICESCHEIFRFR